GSYAERSTHIRYVPSRGEITASGSCSRRNCVTHASFSSTLRFICARHSSHSLNAALSALIAKQFGSLMHICRTTFSSHSAFHFGSWMMTWEHSTPARLNVLVGAVQVMI